MVRFEAVPAKEVDPTRGLAMRLGFKDLHASYHARANSDQQRASYKLEGGAASRLLSYPQRRDVQVDYAGQENTNE